MHRLKNKALAYFLGINDTTAGRLAILYLSKDSLQIKFGCNVDAFYRGKMDQLLLKLRKNDLNL